MTQRHGWAAADARLTRSSVVANAIARLIFFAAVEL
jgi:hypothetical protein